MHRHGDDGVSQTFAWCLLSLLGFTCLVIWAVTRSPWNLQSV